MILNFNDIKFKLHNERGITMETCPVGAHNMHGKVERKIKEVNASLERSVHNERLSILQWETIRTVISNSINDLPIAIGNMVDVENMDLLTPDRLLLGRNNNKSPTGNLLVNSNPTKLINQSSKIYDVWFESWLLNHVPKLMNQSKWLVEEIGEHKVIRTMSKNKREYKVIHTMSKNKSCLLYTSPSPRDS